MVMAEYKIEFTDEAVRSHIHDLREGLGGAAATNIADILEAQIPVPTPLKIGSVVRTENGDEWIRWARDTRTHSPWILASSHETPYRTDEIGRVVEVLSEGVDLP